MDWKNELPVTPASTLAAERQEQIDDEVCALLYHFGPDRHIDGHEEIAAYICGLISAERERCVKIAEHIDDMYFYDGPASGGQYCAGGAHASQEIARRIKSGEEAI